MIDQGKSDVELANADFPIYVKYYKALNHYRMMTMPPRNHDTQVTVIWGPTGTGKSKYCKDQFPEAYWKQRSQWWDNYTSQKTVVIDEFYGWLPFDTLLRLCDRYPLLVETKGGQTQFVAEHIVITSNTIPERWYKHVYFQAFVRRVNHWLIMPTWGDVESYDDYSAAHKVMLDEPGFFP